MKRERVRLRGVWSRVGATSQPNRKTARRSLARRGSGGPLQQVPSVPRRDHQPTRPLGKEPRADALLPSPLPGVRGRRGCIAGKSYSGLRHNHGPLEALVRSAKNRRPGGDFHVLHGCAWFRDWLTHLTHGLEVCDRGILEVLTRPPYRRRPHIPRRPVNRRSSPSLSIR